MAWILIVDDDLDWRKTLRGLLADEGHQVSTAEDEAEALAAAVQTSFDLAIIDVRLHGNAEDDESGLSLAQNLKRIAPHMKVVLLTGYRPRADQVVKSIKFFGVDFIEKSSLGGSSGVDLAAIVKEILDKPSFGPGLDQLSLSFELGQPIVVRTRGAHVCALRTNRVCQLSVPIYNRRAQEARTAPDSRFNVKLMGHDLYRDIFENCHEVLATFSEAKAKRQPLCLSFEGARDFIGIPFEFTLLDQPAEYLILEHPVTRFMNGVVPRRKALSPQAFVQLKGELRVLIVASNTEPSIPGVDREAQQLVHFLENQEYVKVHVDLIPTEEATIARVRRALKDCPAHILHYAGHGSYDELSPEESALFFWSKKNRKGSVESMSAAMLKGLLQDSEVRFAYFSSCHGLATGLQSELLDDDFLGIADAVVQAGVPSTLGFRWPVSDVGAPKLAEAFYGSLLRQGSPEIALWEARRELASLDRDEPTWLSPILIHQV
jgi:CHAT domain-containing protein/CheY-like chemotaxis protein